MNRLFLVTFILTFFIHPAKAGVKDTLDIGLLIASKGQRIAYHKVVRQFEQENPTIHVNYVVRDDAGYKFALEQWLTDKNGPDVLYWQAGERLYQLVNQGLIDPINGVWNQEQWDASFTQGVKNAVMLEGNVYGLPFSYYQWGFYYKKSLFAKLGLQPPKTWEEFLEVGEVLKSNGIDPITIGTKNHWPAAGWFDYLNLRINGLDFHQALMRGKVPYTDDRVRQVFNTWKVLVDQGFFSESPEERDWKQGLPYLYRDRVGMILIGNFVAQHLPSQLVEDMAFFKFPKINENLAFYEEAPTEIFMIPKHGSNKESAKKFLAFMGRPDVQVTLNQGLGYISPNIKAKPSENYFTRIGSETLKEAQGITQFYDRDTSKEMASAGIKLFSDFLKTGDVDFTLKELEKVRQKSF
ncbi:ABC transporter substrate-binding protein [Marinomonas sp. 2405UD68-3]|uniref:ABC transporter substrate-binding protein n=1 Tax=Marinomonas sp. 2405UD68-3 TaxID=3391835 RepID=UPI0039C969DB